MVNLFYNTGWTDDPPGEPDNRYQSTWTWVDPGQTVVLTLPFSGAVNLNHVTAIGFGVGLNGPSSGAPDDYKGTGGTIETNGVPIPASVILLGSGLLGLFGNRRKSTI
jgi:hypothetical protein